MWRVGASGERLPSEQGADHKFRDFLQCYGLRRLLQCSSSNDFCAGHSRDSSRAGVSRNDSRARDSLKTNLVLTLILEAGCVLKVTFKGVTKLSSV